MDYERLLNRASLLVTPTLYKEGVLYPQIPTYNSNGDFTVTRATTATRVNAAGLIELTPYNLVQYSEQFGNVAWSKPNVIVTENVTTAPNGTLTADRVTGNGVSAVHDVLQTGITTLLAGTVYTVSIYAKKDTNNFIQLTGTSAVYGVTAFANFDLNTGAIGTIGSTATATIQSVGNGWYRCSMTATATGTSSANSFIVALMTSATSVRGEVNTLTTSVFIWGAQLVEGTSARDYQMTETRLNIPRLDYSLGSCPNILLEPQRTNFGIQSEDLSSAAWFKGTGVTITADSAISPSGVQNADRVVGATGTGTWASANTLGSSASSLLSRFEISRTTGASTTALAVVLTNSTADFFAWGRQLEAGAYPTSYIPTSSASVTRNADVISRGNIYTNGLITASGGTWFVDLRSNLSILADGGGDALFLGVTTSVNDNCFRIGGATGVANRLSLVKRIGGATSIIFTTTSDTAKIAIKWNGSTADVFVNGVKVVAATAFSETAMQNIATNTLTRKYINSMALFPTPLTDTQCIALTT